jgi:glycosyltransferase involved in cell wall biosynthesis
MHLMRAPDSWADLARRGRERVLAHFTQAQIAAQTVAVYREMTSGQPISDE